MKNSKKVLSYLCAKGMTIQAAAGIYGNLYAESGCRPESRNDKNKEVGIAQETGEGYDRYLAYAADRGKSWYDLYCQLDYIVENCQKNRYKWQSKVDGDENQQYGSVTRMRRYGYPVALVSWTDFCHTQDIVQAAWSFLAIYEDCLYEWTAAAYGRENLAAWIKEQTANRKEYAQKCFDEIMSETKIKNFIQSDPRWANKSYAGENMAAAGCGPTACADVLSYKHPNITPIDTADFLQKNGYASVGSGTYWEGIVAVIRHFGMDCEQLNADSVYGQADTAAEKEFIRRMQTGNYFGILLMGRGFFAKSGHYIVVVVIDGELYIIVYDVAYPPRSVVVKWTDIAQANAPGNAIAQMVAYFRKRVKIFYTIKKDSVPNQEPVNQKTFTANFRQVEPGMHDMHEITLLEAMLGARGYYDYKKYGLDDFYTKKGKLYEAVCKYQKDHVLVVDGKAGPATWRSLLDMTGTIIGSVLKVTLRYKDVNGTGTTVTFVQSILTVLDMYNKCLDKSNGPGCQSGIVLYKEKYLGYTQPAGTITMPLIEHMFGGKFI
ncbi:MAG: phage tail tip lysozyme [Lachnospiraceae bacterium]|nr:phage tail tip lysozyme [Lachnospiraceae bacterium]